MESMFLKVYDEELGICNGASLWFQNGSEERFEEWQDIQADEKAMLDRITERMTELMEMYTTFRAHRKHPPNQAS